MKRLAIALFALTTSCSADRHPPKLLEILEGCKVYQIDAGYRYVYTTLCEGTTHWQEQEGKVTVEKEVQTHRAK